MFARATKPTEPLKALLFHRNEARAAIIRDGLSRAGCMTAGAVSALDGIVQRVVRDGVGILLVDLERPGAAELAAVLQVVRVVDRPVIVFVDRSGSDMTRAAVEAGVSAYIVDDLRPERIPPIIDMATTRFAVLSRLHGELARTRQALADRKVIDRAKGLLMARKGLSEDEAYQLLRRTAMNRERRIIDVAQNVIDTAILLD